MNIIDKMSGEIEELRRSKEQVISDLEWCLERCADSIHYEDRYAIHWKDAVGTYHYAPVSDSLCGAIDNARTQEINMENGD